MSFLLPVADSETSASSSSDNVPLWSYNWGCSQQPSSMPPPDGEENQHHGTQPSAVEDAISMLSQPPKLPSAPTTTTTSPMRRAQQLPPVAVMTTNNNRQQPQNGLLDAVTAAMSPTTTTSPMMRAQQPPVTVMINSNNRQKQPQNGLDVITAAMEAVQKVDQYDEAYNKMEAKNRSGVINKRKRVEGKGYAKIQDNNKIYIKEEDIRDKDILLGRGGKSNHHEGNKIYRVFVWDAQHDYKKLNEFTQKKEKRDISRGIVTKLQEHGCRFLQRDNLSKNSKNNLGQWYEVTDKVAFDKVSQALRDPTPEQKREKKAMKQKAKAEAKKAWEEAMLKENKGGVSIAPKKKRGSNDATSSTTSIQKKATSKKMKTTEEPI